VSACNDTYAGQGQLEAHPRRRVHIRRVPLKDRVTVEAWRDGKRVMRNELHVELDVA
jgi:hypothetical protein